MASRRAPGNLPTEVSSFVGRHQEEHDLRQLLSQARLVSVIGPGGVGKSRLALRVATKLQRTFRVRHLKRQCSCRVPHDRRTRPAVDGPWADS